MYSPASLAGIPAVSADHMCFHHEVIADSRRHYRTLSIRVDLGSVRDHRASEVDSVVAFAARALSWFLRVYCSRSVLVHKGCLGNLLLIFVD